MKRKFEVTYLNSYTIEIDEEVFKVVTEEWKNTFYNLNSEKDIVDHLTYNIGINNSTLKELDGFAHLQEDMVTIEDTDCETLEITEIKEKNEEGDDDNEYNHY